MNQEALNAIHKGQSVADIERAAKACRDHGIRVIASLVLGLDEDSVEDIRASVAFAKSIDAYQIQPAILTPFPGTPVYEQFVQENRMVTDEWALFDMCNVVFQPKQMSPWALQDEFYRAVDGFYDFPSAIRIGRLFGAEYAWRRIYLSVVTVIGPAAARFASDHVKISPYYYLKHLTWKYLPAPAAGDESVPALEEGAAPTNVAQVRRAQDALDNEGGGPGEGASALVSPRNRKMSPLAIAGSLLAGCCMLLVVIRRFTGVSGASVR